MAGGVGARFWPMSNSTTPKQFIDILGEGKTLIQKTFDRFTKICPKENIYIVTSKAYKDITLEQLPDIQEEQVILEPYRRNTAPCIAYANYKIKTKNPNAVAAKTETATNTFQVKTLPSIPLTEGLVIPKSTPPSRVPWGQINLQNPGTLKQSGTITTKTTKTTYFKYDNILVTLFFLTFLPGIL